MLARSLVSGDDSRTIRIFFSYPHARPEDQRLLSDRLARFRWAVDVHPWSDEDLQGGECWLEAIPRLLNQADIVLFFVCNEFMQSEYIRTVEIPKALERQREGKCRIIPIILEETEPDWRTCGLGAFHPLPGWNRPVTSFGNPDEAFITITQGIANIITAEGLYPQARQRWKLHLEGTLANLDLKAMDEWIWSLRGLTRDPTLRPVRIEKGSVVLLMESTRAAIATVMDAYRRHTLPIPEGWTILDLYELFGAQVAASATTCNGTNAPFPADKISLPVIDLEGDWPAPVMSIIKVDEETGKFHYKIDDIECRIRGEMIGGQSKAQMVSHFLTGLAVPNDDHWVNLAPDDSSRMLPNALTTVSEGEVMLRGDLLLKQLTSSLMHPDTPSGREFWQEVFQRTYRIRGTHADRYQFFPKVWIKPGEIVLMEWKNAMVISNFFLRLDTERPTGPQYEAEGECDEVVQDVAYEVFNERIVPILSQEINNGRLFAPTRSLMSCLTCAQWVKKRFETNEMVNPVLDSEQGLKNVLAFEAREGICVTTDAAEYYEIYRDLYLKGMYSVARDDYDPCTQSCVTRSYVSGAIDLRRLLPRKMDRTGSSGG